MSYRLKLEIFEGPLDLLLFLIKKDDIDITNIPVAQVTDQYMKYIEMMQVLDLDIVGDFLVMAATLMQIKSRMLLPPDPNSEQEQEEDPRDELVRRLMEYKKFKEIAETLQSKEQWRRNLFSRHPDEEWKEQIVNESKEVYFEASLFDLISALSEAIKKTPEEVLHEIIREEYTVEQKIHDILHLLVEKSAVSLHHLFARAVSKQEMVVTFLAVLELIRLKEIRAMQKEHFGDIEVIRNTENIAPVVQNQNSSETIDE
jgi:segregation and condensation protein A